MADVRGASPALVTQRDLWAAWYGHHLQSAASSLRQLWQTPIQSLATCLVIAIALGLPAAFLLVVDNVKNLSAHWHAEPGITLYVKRNLGANALESVGRRLAQLPGVASVEYISPEQGLEELKQQGGFGDALSVLDENPLPPVFIVRPLQHGESAVSTLSAQLRALPEVEKVQVDLDWVKRLQHLLSLARHTALWLAVFLCAGVCLIIGNTIRLIIERRREEIVVLKLVGATDAYVARPLLYGGFWYGLWGGLLAWLLLAMAGSALSPFARKLLESYGSDLVISSPGLTVLLGLLGWGALLGIIGAWWAARGYIRSAA